jgi:hypothetical protein
VYTVIESRQTRLEGNHADSRDRERMKDILYFTYIADNKDADVGSLQGIGIEADATGIEISASIISVRYRSFPVRDRVSSFR